MTKTMVKTMLVPINLNSWVKVMTSKFVSLKTSNTSTCSLNKGIHDPQQHPREVGLF